MPWRTEWKDHHVGETFRRQSAPCFFVERCDDLIAGCGRFEHAASADVSS
jgi:hypothetical protein